MGHRGRGAARPDRRQLSQRRHLPSAGDARSAVARRVRHCSCRPSRPVEQARSPARIQSARAPLRVSGVPDANQAPFTTSPCSATCCCAAAARTAGRASACAIRRSSCSAACSRRSWPGDSALQDSTACAMLVTWFLIALAGIDLDHQLLPDSLTLPLLWLGLLASLTGWSAPGKQSAGGSGQRHQRGGRRLSLALGDLSCLSAADGQGRHGLRRFQAARGALGAWLGLQMLLPIVLLSALVGALVGISLIRPAPPPSRHAHPIRSVPGRCRLARDDVGARRCSALPQSVRRPAADDGCGAATRPPLRVGLTGGVASGKSSRRALFAALGVPDHRCRPDRARSRRRRARALRETPVRAASVPSNAIRGPDGGLDRAALRRLVFRAGGPAARTRGLVASGDSSARIGAAGRTGDSGPYQLHVNPLMVETQRCGGSTIGCWWWTARQACSTSGCARAMAAARSRRAPCSRRAGQPRRAARHRR
jgi:hypothetical protein